MENTAVVLIANVKSHIVITSDHHQPQLLAVNYIIAH
jgi:hypothetical protein